jgi:hypothetical protein
VSRRPLRLLAAWLPALYPSEFAGLPRATDNEEMAVFWVGLSSSPTQIKDLFGVDDVNDLDPRLVGIFFSLQNLPCSSNLRTISVLL